MNVNEIFAERLKELRAERGLTQGKLAEMADIARNSVYSYECMKRTPDIDVLAKFADILNTTADYLLGLSDRAAKKTPWFGIMLDDGAFAPVRAHEFDAGADLLSPVDGVVYPGDSLVIDTGVHIAIPEGYAGFLKSKSGLNVNQGILSDGTIDAGYTGSIRVKLYNHGERPVEIKRGMKITQIVIQPVVLCGFQVVDRFEETERGDGGFGSTGV